MRTKRSNEAYILIDHRNSPGISQEFVRANNLDIPAVSAGTQLESAMIVCGHCGTDVILNPNRSREREWCWNCDKYICDGCGVLKKLGEACSPLEKKLQVIYKRLTA